MKDLREQYGKALPQLKQLDEEEMDQFLYKYAELKIDIIDEQDGLEGKKVQTGSGVDDDGEYEEYEGDTDEEAVDEEGDTDTNNNNNNRRFICLVISSIENETEQV